MGLVYIKTEGTNLSKNWMFLAHRIDFFFIFYLSSKTTQRKCLHVGRISRWWACRKEVESLFQWRSCPKEVENGLEESHMRRNLKMTQPMMLRWKTLKLKPYKYFLIIPKGFTFKIVRSISKSKNEGEWTRHVSGLV